MNGKEPGIPPLRQRIRHVGAARRTADADRALATMLAAIAGCANAGGFILLGSYTSHMTGYLSQVADQIVLGNIALVLTSLVALLLFLCGAATSAAVINWARRHRPARQYAVPLGLEGALFLVLVVLGALYPGGLRLVELGLLCFIMGLQNATITKISGAVIRTTHATGMMTDLGIEIGRAVYGTLFRDTAVGGDRAKLAILARLLGVFVVGGLVGAVGYGVFGMMFSLPLGLLLLGLALIAA